MVIEDVSCLLTGPLGSVLGFPPQKAVDSSVNDEHEQRYQFKPELPFTGGYFSVLPSSAKIFLVPILKALEIVLSFTLMLACLDCGLGFLSLRHGARSIARQ
jgi:hypothetical protein